MAAPTHLLNNSSEIKSAFSQVVVDGRFINEFNANSQNVSDKLGLTLSQQAHSTLASINGKVHDSLLQHQTWDTTSVAIVIIVVIVAVVVLVCIPTCRSYLKGLISDPNADSKC